MRSEKLTLIGTMASGVAHETLNPLNIISAIVQVLQMEDLPDEVQENLGEIMTQVKRATKIMNDIRMFAHKKEAQISPVDIHALFDKTASLIERNFELENIIIKRDYDADPPTVEGDEDKLAQVFLNLLKNAKDAMKGRKNNLITIKTLSMKDKMEFRFSDTGPGIPRDIVNRIFDPFFTTKGEREGTGLGLSLVHSIIESHNGTIRVESEEGEGTTFVIMLPTGIESEE